MKLTSRAGRVAIAIAAMLPVQSAIAAPADEPKAGSLYLQCDGNPNNMTSGESAARLLGAVTLLALFAPPPESADSSKRKFGAEGVAACTEILDGDKKEGNPSRRIGLFLGRAIHRIEQKEYEAAIADTNLARQEATAAGLMANPYYARSQARGFDLIESAALFRLGRAADAREAALRNAGSIKHSIVPLILMPDYLASVRTGSDAETNFLKWRSRSEAVATRSEADRLEELGRFADAADVREALVDFDRASTPEMVDSHWLAQAAVSLALAGRKDLAAQRATEARANFDKRIAEGKPENDAANFVELMDLYGIIQTASAGDAKTARRLFAARSQWVAASFGSVIEMTRRLRAGAAPDDLIGGLAHDPEQMWKERAEASKAKMIVTDASNKELFLLIPPVSTAGSYEALSKRIWQVQKSSILLKRTTSDAGKNKLETLFLYGGDLTTTMEAYTLHAALLAKSRGQQGFVITPLFDKNIIAAFIMTGNRGAPGFAEPLFNDADEVIADLSPLFPSPETLKARRAAH